MPSERLSVARRARLAFATTALFLAFGGVAQAQQCPDWTENGAEISYNSDTLYTPRAHDVTAGGGVDLAQCSDLPGFGYVGLGPDLTLNYVAGRGRSLSIRAESSCDTVILVNTPTAAWEYDDDGAGDLDPMVWFDNAQSGIYDIWVGTIENDLCAATLILETFD